MRCEPRVQRLAAPSTSSYTSMQVCHSRDRGSRWSRSGRRSTARAELPCPLLCDPDHVAYRAYGLGQWPVERVLYDAPPVRGTSATSAREFRTSRDAGRPPVDDPWRATAEFVVGRRRGPYALPYQYCEDFPVPRLLTAAARLSRRRSAASGSLGAVHLRRPGGPAYRPPQPQELGPACVPAARAERPPPRSQLAGLLFAEADDPAAALRWSLAELRRGLGERASWRATRWSCGCPPDTVVDVDVVSAGVLDGGHRAARAWALACYG